jgi:hypothetical protein
MRHWYGDLSQFAFPWKGSGVDGNGAVWFVYNGHLWTIPVEFCGSIVVFVTVLGLSGGKRDGWMRILIGMGLVGNSLVNGRWDVSLFLGGMVLAEWSRLSVRAGSGGRRCLGVLVLDYVVVFWCTDLFWRLVDWRVPR